MVITNRVENIRVGLEVLIMIIYGAFSSVIFRAHAFYIVSYANDDITAFRRMLIQFQVHNYCVTCPSSFIHFLIFRAVINDDHMKLKNFHAVIRGSGSCRFCGKGDGDEVRAGVGGHKENISRILVEVQRLPGFIPPTYVKSRTLLIFVNLNLWGNCNRILLCFGYGDIFNPSLDEGIR